MEEMEKCAKCGREAEDGKCTGPCALPIEQCTCGPMDQSTEGPTMGRQVKEMDDDGGGDGDDNM